MSSPLPAWAKSADPGIGWYEDDDQITVISGNHDFEVMGDGQLFVYTGCARLGLDFPSSQIAIAVAETIIKGLRGELEVPS